MTEREKEWEQSELQTIDRKKQCQKNNQNENIFENRKNISHELLIIFPFNRTQPWRKKAKWIFGDS